MNINLGNTIQKGVHGPLADDAPLYTRVDDYESDSKNKGNKWLRMSTTHFNSPTNIRSVYITHNKILTKLYKGVYENQKLGKKVLEKSIKNLELERYAGNICQAQPMSKLEYKASGTGLKSLARPWVCSNIEELYFDWTCLIDAVEILGFTKVQGILTQRVQLTPQDILQLICAETKCTPKDINIKYPRLHKIVYAFNLDSCLLGYELDNNQLQNLIASNQATVLRLEQVRRNKFSIRLGIYKYDDIVLSKHIKEFTSTNADTSNKAKQQEATKQQITPKKETIIPQEVPKQDSNTQTNNRPTVPSTEEKLLISIYTKKGYSGLKKTLNMCDNLQSLLGSLTQDGYDLCKKALQKDN